MKKLFSGLSLLMVGGLAQAATLGPVAISSGSAYYNVDTSSITGTSRVRQNIVIADPGTSAGLAPVDALNGLAVYLTTSTAAGIGSLSAGTAEIGNVKNSGTFAAQAAQSGTWTVQPGNTANTTAWKVDGSAVTQPVSGTVTANQGTPGKWGIDLSTGALVVQGAAGTSAWKIDSSTGIKVTGNALMVDVGTGTWPVSIVAGAGTGGTSSNYTATFPTAGNAVGFINSSGQMQAARVDTSSNAIVTQGTAGTSAWKVDFSTGVQALQGAAGTSGWKVDFSTGVQVLQGAAGTSAWKIDSSTGIKVTGNALMVDVGTGTWPVSGTFSATAVSVTTGTFGAGTFPGVGAAIGFSNGGTMQAGRVDVSSNIFVTLVQPTVIGATVTYNGTQTVSATQGTAGTSKWGVDSTTGIYVVGGVAQGTAMAGNPLPTGLVVSSATLPTVRANATAIYAAGSTIGQVLVTGVPEEVIFTTYSAVMTSATVVNAAGVTEAVLVSSPAANFFTYLCGCTFTNTTATNGAVIIESPQGVATSRWAMGVPSNYIPVGTKHDCVNPFYRSAVASNIYIYQTVASSTQNVYMRCSYYTGP